MRLYLSSFRLGNAPEKLVEMMGTSKTALIINNAVDYSSDSETRIKDRQEIDLLAGLGIDAQPMDLLDYRDNPDDLRRILSSVGLIWARGGNTFLLRRAMRYSGFDKLLPELLQSDSVVYGGYSAGVCVLAPSLRGLELCDEPYQIPKGYEPEVIWEGLNVIDYAIAPHYKSDHPESQSIDKVVDYFENHNVKYKALHDGEVIVINGDRTEILS